MSKPRLILASRSPRRAELLRDAGFDFDVIASPFEDPPQPQALNHQTPEDLAIQLAMQKANALWQTLPTRELPFTIILAADTIALSPDRHRLLGTPTSDDEVRDMLQTFRNTSHDVITGVCIQSSDQPQAFADVATVRLGELLDNDIERYIETNCWRGKAGGYNLTDRMNAGWPIEVDGDPTCVTGLPMRRVEPKLKPLLPG